MSFSKFSDLIRSSSLYFSPIEKMSDEHEGRLWDEDRNNLVELNKKRLGQNDDQALGNTIKLKGYIENNRNKIFINCWTAKNDLSFPLWKLYASDRLGIAIRSDISSLQQSFNKEVREVNIADVSYDSPSYNGSTSHFYLKKRGFYSEENETRCVVQLVDDDISFTNNPRIKVDLKQLIKSIYISPNADVDFKFLMESLLKKYELDIPIQPTGIFDKNI